MKNRILSLLLALVLLLSMIPVQIFAENASETTEEPTGETVLETTSPEDNCPYCEETTAEDGTVTHSEGCTAAYVYDGTEDVDKYVQLIPEVAAEGVWVSGNHDNDDGIWFYYDEFGEGTIMRITDWYWDASTTALWYCVELYEGSFPESTEDYTWPSTPWILCDYTDTTYQNEAVLEFVTVQPETPGQGGDDGVTDASGQVTVKGSLPADATVEITNVTDSAIMSELGIEGGFVADISILSNGAIWQPDGTVTITLKVNGDYPIITHYLDDVDAITTGIADGSAMVMDVSGKSEATKALLASAIAGYQTATGTTDEKVAAGCIYDVKNNGDGTISFATDSLSVFTGEDYTGQLADWFDLSAYDGQTLYITANQQSLMRVPEVTTSYGQTAFYNWSVSDKNLALFGPANNLTNLVPLVVGSEFTFTCQTGYTDWRGTHTQNTYTVTFKVIYGPYDVTFNAQGGTVDANNQETYTMEVKSGTVDTMPTATKSGYALEGWYRADGTKITSLMTLSPDVDNNNPTTNDVTLYAKWVEGVNLTLVGNGGKVNGSDQDTVSVPKGVPITLPTLESYTANGKTYYFDGWYTAAEGGRPIGAINVDPNTYIGESAATELVYTHAFTEDTTLYAHWTEHEDLAGNKNFIMIGLINNYYLQNQTYDISTGKNADGTDIWDKRPSYQAFPNEPSKVGHYNTYRVDDLTGNWTLENKGQTTYPLRSSPADYIDPSILTSDYFVQSPTNNDKTKGVFDSTGINVYNYIYLDEADQHDIIKAWLTMIIDGNDGYNPSVAAQVKADLESEYNVDFAGKTADDLVEHFKLVPYVVKHHYDQLGDIGWWVIDMVILPKTQVILGYDLNIPTGYSLAAGAAPITTTHDLDSTAPVTTAPEGVVVSKTVGDTTVKAIFSHWVDEAGNTYGGITGNNAILMDDNKVLKAVWILPEEEDIPGSLEVKKVVNAVDGNIKPVNPPVFSFVFNIDKNGTYQYTIYGGAQSTSGTIANGGTFDLYDGWSIIIKELPAGAHVTVTETNLPQYYIPAKTVEERTILAGQRVTSTFTNAYPRVYYNVEHYLQNTDGMYTLKDTEQLVGTVGEETAAKAKPYAGYTAQAFEQETILADGSTVVKIYYNRTPYTLTINHVEEGNPSNVLGTSAETVYYGDVINSSTRKQTFPGYEYVSAVPDSVTVDGNETITLYYKPTTGNLIISKTVTGTGAPADAEFTFTVTFSDNTTKTVTLKAGESKTLTNVPVGAFTATENTPPTGFQAVNSTITGTITAGGTATAAFTNNYELPTVKYTVKYLEQDTNKELATEKTASGAVSTTVTENAITISGYSVVGEAQKSIVLKTNAAENVIIFYYARDIGNLTINKTVTKENTTDMWTSDTFEFTITGSGLTNGAYSVKIGNDPAETENITNGTLELNASIPVDAVNTKTGITITGLPVGSYTVTETAKDGYTPDKTAATVTVTGNATATVDFTNTLNRYVGGLTVTKNVAPVGNATETVTDFYFDITVPSGVTGTYTYTVGTDSREATVTERKLTIYIQNGQTAEFTNLPIGEYTVTERNYADKGYSASYEDNSGNTTDGVVTVTKGGTATVSCKNAFPVGSITITKTVSKENSGDTWSGDTFTFIISGTSLVNGTSYPVYEGTTLLATKTVVDGVLTVEITFDKVGTKTIKIDELPQGSYQIVETSNNAYIQTSSNTVDPSVLTVSTSITPNDYSGEASFTNTLKRYVGNLKIEKEVNVTSGTAPDTTFIFTVKPAQGVSFDKISYTVVYTGTQSGTVIENVVDGKLTLELKANESVEIKGLPVGDYAVTEAPAPGFASSFDGGNTVSSEVNATVPKDGQASVVCTNRYPAYTGNLRIDKDVIEAYSRDTLPDHSFSITVTLTPDQNAVLVDRSYSYQIYDRNGNKVGDVVNGTIVAGSISATITVGLKDGQYVVITDLPTGVYSVTENLGDLANDYNTPTYEAQTGMIEADQMAQATVKNKYKQHLGTLTITKTVNGGTAGDTFIFHVKGIDASNSYIDMDVTITGSGSVTIHDLPLGNYNVTEDTNWSWRYILVGDSFVNKTITLDALHANAAFTNKFDQNQWLNYTVNMPNVFGKKEDEQEGS